MRSIRLFLLVLFLLLGSQGSSYVYSVFVPSTATFDFSPIRHLGFWVDERQMWSGSGLGWSASTFFDNYFLTAPYPSTMLFATGPSQIQGYMNTKAINWLPQVASLADAYPNIQINVLVFINLTDSSQVAELQNFVNALKGHSSIYGFEYEREYFGNTIAQNQLFCNIVNSGGFTCIMDPSVASSFPSNPSLGYCEFPYFQSSDSVEACIYSGIGQNEIGRGFGEYAFANFPAQCTIPMDPYITADPPCNGWNKQVIQAIVNDSLYAPIQNRIFTYIYAGYVVPNSPLWNSSLLRGFVWNDPNYILNYALSNALWDPSETTMTNYSSSFTGTSTSFTRTSTVTTNSVDNSTTLGSSTTTTSYSSFNPSTGIPTILIYVVIIVFLAAMICYYAIIIVAERKKTHNSRRMP